MTRGDQPSDQALEWLERLVAIPTVSRNSNLGLIEMARDILAGLGATCRLTYDAAGGKANLLATFGAGREGGLVFSGHTDVVPVTGQAWDSDPFRLERRGELLFGRGTADMKGFIAAVLAQAPAMAARGGERPIHIALSYDEEVGCLGAPAMIADMIAQGMKPFGCVIGEPTEMRVALGHKGACAYRCRVCGREAHASLAPTGVNAIEYAARLIERLRTIGLRLQAQERRGEAFDVPFTTISSGVISGGVATNIVPRDCEFRIDLRHLPWTAPETIIGELERYARDELLPEMRAVAPEAEIVLEPLGRVAALDTASVHPFARFVLGLRGPDAVPGQVAFGTEGGLFDAAGIPTVICGPGSIVQAHKPNEFIALSQVFQAEQFIAQVIGAPASEKG